MSAETRGTTTGPSPTRPPGPARALVSTPRPWIAQAVDRATVAVLAGGRSSEREISLQTGAGVARALREGSRDERGPAHVAEVEIRADGTWLLEGIARSALDAVAALPEDTLFFLALHGGEGENGAVQGFLELAGRRYTGSGVGASALCMDKTASRHVLAATGATVAPGLTVDLRSWSGERSACLERLEALASRSRGERLYVKPNAGGSSVLTFRVQGRDELAAAVTSVVESGDAALVEAAVEGVEATCGVLGNTAGELVALPPVEIVPHEGRFFDYEEKYRSEGAREHCPPRSLSAATVERLGQLAVLAHRTMGCDGYSRTDFIVPRGADDASEGEGEPVVLEVNTLPGLTERSLFPQSMHALGASYRAMCLRLLELAVERSAERGTEDAG